MPGRGIPPLIALPLIALPLIALPLIALPLIALPLIALPLIALPLIALPLIALPLIALPLIEKHNHGPSSSAPWHRHRVQLTVDVIQGVKHERRARGPRFTPQRADRDASPTPRRSRRRDARGSPTHAAPARPRPPGGRSGNT